MNDKHFIWIIPTLLVVGFIVGYISGLNIPDKVTFEIDKDSREWLSLFANQTDTTNNECYITQQICERDIRNKDNSYLYCVMNIASNTIEKINGTAYVPYEQLNACVEIIDTMPGLLYR